MISLIQRVKVASIKIANQKIATTDSGVLLFLGIAKKDNIKTCEKMLDKVLNYRIFTDQDEKMNLSLLKTNKELLIVPQFTLVANTTSGTRASFSTAKKPTDAKKIYDYFTTIAKNKITTQTGVFAADMQVSLTNDGPISFILEV